MVVSQHRLLEYIISDHDTHFCDQFWDELIPFLETSLTFSIASYPQTGGIAEVMDHTIEHLL